MTKPIERILVTGALGQIGTELVAALRARYGTERVVATDVREAPQAFRESGPFHTLDVTDLAALEDVTTRYRIDTVFHLAAVLSATGEKDPVRCWEINMRGTMNVLRTGVARGMARILIPSSIAVWGKGVPSPAPQESALKPTTMYGVTKVAGELLGDYFVRRFNLDVRGLRYPGIISAETFPGGGTTDYAVAIYYDAVRYGRYTCFVREDTRLPMMYMPDCITAIIDLAEADFASLKHHCDFNVGSMSFSAGELAASIRRHIPDFTVEYKPDERQIIADSWPDEVDDSAAREEWGWRPRYDLEAMTADMLAKLREKHARGEI
ncbi:MAG: NAD-dependent epimerase/dehydratase family protein [Bacteroidota bacterium]|nr:NAD-dependent epimerase/dehydratase family protein [Bacteroidota bacterium]